MDGPFELIDIVRTLPRKRVAFVVAVVLAHFGILGVWQSRRIALERPCFYWGRCVDCYTRGPGSPPCGGPRPSLVPPWKWTASEWKRALPF